MTLIITGMAHPQDARSYRLLPFRMPTEATRLTVRYAFGQEIGSGSGIIDIGVFDERGTDFLTNGFRGWSGSARREFTLTPSNATPGYTPGPLQEGVWHICLGLYTIASDGCGYRVEVEIETGTDVPAITPALLALSDRPLPGRRSPDGWYKGDLHCHTYHSDGDSDPLDVIRRAEDLGFDFLAITDHNVLSQHMVTRTANTPLMLIPGMEVTTYHGHWNAWGDGGWIDFRVAGEADLRQSMEAARARGYLVSCNHPKAYGPAWSFGSVDTFDCVEVWNGPWQLFNDQSLAFWEALLRAGKRPTAVGGSDAHFHQQQHVAQLGHPTTCIYCVGDPSPARLLAALQAGQAFISDGPHLSLRCGDAVLGQTVRQAQTLAFDARVKGGAGCTLQFHGVNGLLHAVQVASDDEELRFSAPAGTAGYVRAQLVDGAQVRALTNPIYIAIAGDEEPR